MLNETLVYFGKSRETITAALFQYNYGQKLIIKDLELPFSYEVHFCNDGDAETIMMTGGPDGVLIPDNLLETGKNVLAYIFLHETNSDGQTKYTIRTPVIRRGKPSDIEFTPTEESTVSQLINTMNTAVEQSGASAESAQQSAARAGQSAVTADQRAEDSEAWAVGERNGVAVDRTDETYRNNSKWWANVAQQGAVDSGFAWFDVDNSDGCAYVTITPTLAEKVRFQVNEEIGVLEVVH
jgi:hypothetical protein